MGKKQQRHGPRGYVRCRICGVEVPEISRETPEEYAGCRRHGTWPGRAAEEREKKKAEFFEQKRKERAHERELKERVAR